MKANYKNGIRHILAISRHGNQYMQAKISQRIFLDILMQANQPWVLLKGSPEEK
jgi:hypothetical protein